MRLSFERVIYKGLIIWVKKANGFSVQFAVQKLGQKHTLKRY